MVCDCHWLQHRHITYEYRTNRTHIMSNNTRYRGRNREMSLRDIDQRITDLREEERQIQDVYQKLAGFLHANSILPINDDILEYLRYFIREEQMKQGAGAHNNGVIAGLENMMAEFISNMERFRRTLKEQKESGSMRDVIEPEEIFTLVGTLYRLPITGQQIRRQVEGIKISQEKYGNQRENSVTLPAKAASSKVMIQMRKIISAR